MISGEPEYARKELAFPIEEYKYRLNKLKEHMNSSGLEGVLSFSPKNCFYITGCQSILPVFGVAVIPLEGEPTLIVWGDSELPMVYLTSWLSGENTVGFDTGEDYVKVTHRILKEKCLENKKIGLEDVTLDPETYVRLTGFDAQFVNSSLIQGLRHIKSEREIEYIRKAARMTEKGMKAAIDAIQAGVTDNHIASKAVTAMIDAGSEYFCSQPFVSAGLRAGIPHSHWHRKTIEKGDSVLLEVSGVYNRYNAPLMRSAFVGEPNQRVLEMFNGCKLALDNILESVAPGKKCDEVAKAGKEGISLIKEPIIFHKTYGYSIGSGFTNWGDGGLIITEGNTTTLKPGNVFHSTMSVRDPGKYGICLSETYLVTDKGCEVLTNFERTLF